MSSNVFQVIKAWRAKDGTYTVPRIDGATDALQMIDYAHYEIHAENHFFYTDKVELDSTEAQVYLITTPNTTKWAHMTFSATGSAITQIDLYESSDRNGVTGQTLYNSNRNSNTAATVIVHKGITSGSTDGTLIYTMKSGAATNQSRTPMAAQRGNEIVLKQNTKYLLRITSGSDNNLTNLQLEWYEHTNVV